MRLRLAVVDEMELVGIFSLALCGVAKLENYLIWNWSHGAIFMDVGKINAVGVHLDGVRCARTNVGAIRTIGVNFCAIRLEYNAFEMGVCGTGMQGPFAGMPVSGGCVGDAHASGSDAHGPAGNQAGNATKFVQHGVAELWMNVVDWV